MQLAFSQLLNGVGLGMIYFLVAIGLSLIFGLMRFVNFAHGAFYLLGAYVTFSVSRATGSFFIGIAVAVVFVALFAAMIERLILARIYALPPYFHILATFGLTLMIEEGVRMIWTAAPQLVKTPELFRGLTFIGPLFYPNYRLLVITIAAISSIGVWAVLERTKLGAAIRAGAENREVVMLLGLNISGLFMANFVLGAALAAFAGGLISPIRGVDPYMGVEAIGIAFVICVVGGLGSFKGTLIAALVIGILQSFATSMWGAGAGIVAYLVMAVVLLIKPQGLFSSPAGQTR